MQSLVALPSNLPVPLDDGACNHLIGLRLPDIALLASNHQLINPSLIDDWLVIYCYPMTGLPNVTLPSGWDDIPGARGCTPQSCAFRDNFAALAQLKVQVFGLSMQNTAYQQEAATRLQLPYALLSDEKLAFTHALKLPTFQVENFLLNKRVTLIAYEGVIQHYFYPVFPPDKNVDDVIAWLKNHV